MKLTITIILLLSLISCHDSASTDNDRYYICTPILSNDCKEVDNNEYERYIEQYQVCEVHNNIKDCLNLYEY